MAKFFVRGTKVKFDAVADKSAYKDSIVFLTDTKLIYLNGVYYGLSDEDAEKLSNLKDSVDALKCFQSVRGNSGEASAPNKNSILNIKGSTDEVVHTTVNENGVSIDVKTMTAASASAAGARGLVPASKAGDQAKVLSAAGTWVAQTTNTDTKVTSAANHYSPTADAASALSATAGKYISGISRDSKGHVTAITETSLPTLDDCVKTSRKVSAGEGLTGGGTLATDVTISHGSKPTTGTATSGTGKFVTAVNVDKFGHVASVTGSNLVDGDIPSLATSKITACTGYSVGTDSVIAAGDTLNLALGKVQGQINALKTSTNGLVGALLFKGVLESLPATTNYNQGDVIIVSGKEYVLTGEGSSKEWQEFGDQSLMGTLRSNVADLLKKPGLDKVGTVTSVGLSVPTGLKVTGSPITTSGTLTLAYTDGYSIPTISKQEAWDKLVSFPGYATVAPLANGTASVGGSEKVAREDHVHPLQTSVSGNAGTATKLATARTISLSGDLTGSTTFDGSANVTISTSLEWEEL